MPPFSPSIAETRQALERHGIVSASPLLFQALAMVRRAALRGAAILLIGAPGTGKELIARYAHACSERANQPIVVVDCTTIPDTLAESVLLGHARGSFTGAASAHLGLVEQADGGFLFLDEVGDLTAKSQSVLLPVLEKGEYRSIGSNAVRRVDLQVVAATNKDLRLEVEQGRFRQDLFNRLDIVTVPIPSLCERPEDIPLLARHFVANHPAIRRGTVRGIDDAACKLLEAHPWPGNVRELRNMLVKASMLTDDEILGREHIELVFQVQRLELLVGATFIAQKALEILQHEHHVHLATVVAVTRSPRTTVERTLERMADGGQIVAAKVRGRVVFLQAGPRSAEPCPCCACAEEAEVSAGQVDARGAVTAEVVREQESRPSDPDPQAGAKDGGLSPREQAAMDIAQGKGRVTRAMLVETGMPKDTAYKVLRRLVQKGLLVKEGETGCRARYVVVD